MTGPEDMVEARLYYLEKTAQVVSVERSGCSWCGWWVQVLMRFPDGEWIWRDMAYCDSLRAVAEFLRPQQPVILLEELW
jgi:hypothetical protein